MTARQLDVLALLVDGLSNADIAARLVISPKTADHHVSAILAKLDVRSRVEAAAVARRLGLRAGDSARSLGGPDAVVGQHDPAPGQPCLRAVRTR